jgi:hypothetical protein
LRNLLPSDKMGSTCHRLLPASFEVLQRGTYVALLVVQNVTLLAAVVILIAVTRGMLAYEAAA